MDLKLITFILTSGTIVLIVLMIISAIRKKRN